MKKQTNLAPGCLYIVATPIGNLEDMSSRAINTLQTVDIIAAEDTRHSQKLLSHFQIKKPLMAVHEHNERQKTQPLLAQIQSGLNVALISDAGTPLISDPGYPLVHLAHELGIKIIPIPGPCALITALSASGLPTDRFIFEGFLPVKANLKLTRLEALSIETATLIFYESPHRILASLNAMLKVFGQNRKAVIARELTKNFETIVLGTLNDLVEKIKLGNIPERGEMVILVHGAEKTAKASTGLNAEDIRILEILLETVSVKEAALLVAKITGVSKRLVYNYAISKTNQEK